MVFLDGFGLGRPNQVNNPYVTAKTPFLDRILGGHFLYQEMGPIENCLARMLPTKTQLGVQGFPQSATGQTTLWTGINAAAQIGFHINGYPTGPLIKILEEASIFKQLKDLGKKVAFANAYRPKFFSRAARRWRRRSTSTVAALSAGLVLRTLDDLCVGKAVYQDITNEMLLNLGYDVPLFTPEEAGKRLAHIAIDYDFTLFEYFQTDITGHRQDFPKAQRLLTMLDRFLEAVVSELNLQEFLLMVVSDHGNIEDLSTATHTLNPVPTICIGSQLKDFPLSIQSLEDITPFVVRWFLVNDE